jgi:hypothetical protein
LGALINEFPRTFYWFEPLLFVDHYQNASSKTVSMDESIHFLSQLFKCNYSHGIAREFVRGVFHKKRIFMAQHNLRFFSGCR